MLFCVDKRQLYLYENNLLNKSNFLFKIIYQFIDYSIYRDNFR